MSSFMKWWVMILSGSRDLETYFLRHLCIPQIFCHNWFATVKSWWRGAANSQQSSDNLCEAVKTVLFFQETLMNRVKSIVRYCFCTCDDQLPASISVLFVIRYSRHSSFRISRFQLPHSTVCYCWLDSTFADWFIEKEEIPGNGISSS